MKKVKVIALVLVFITISLGVVVTDHLFTLNDENVGVFYSGIIIATLAILVYDAINGLKN